MNNPKILAQTMASSYLAQTWNMDVLQRAFVEKWPHQLGYALELFVPMVPRPLVDLVKLYDGAGMMKTEMASAIWQAARVHYDAEVFAQAQAVRAAAKGSLAVQAVFLLCFGVAGAAVHFNEKGCADS